MKNSQRNQLLSIISILIFVSSFSISSLQSQAKTDFISQPIQVSTLTPSESILIYNNGNFSDYSLPGTGTAQDPFRIENYNVTTLNNIGIKVQDTTDHFVIQNCYIDASFTGIAVNGVTPGTGKISNVICVNHEYYGIAIVASQITIEDSLIKESTENFGWGILLLESSEINITNNTCLNNNYGLIVQDSNSSYIHYNTFEDNIDHGVYLQSSSKNNIVHHNKFINNNEGASHQASDDGTDNVWYEESTKEGNYWDNWNDPKTPVPILGSAGSEDPYPLEEDLTREANLYLISILFGLVLIAYRRRKKS